VRAGRGYVTPADVKASAVPCLAHRIVTDADDHEALGVASHLLGHVLDTVPAPRP
jgi:hypothetical protein